MASPTIGGAFVRKMGRRVIKPAPNIEPNTLPSPPMMIIKRTGKETLRRSNASVSALPSQTNMYKAPATPQKKELIPNAKSFA